MTKHHDEIRGKPMQCKACVNCAQDLRQAIKEKRQWIPSDGCLYGGPFYEYHIITGRKHRANEATSEYRSA